MKKQENIILVNINTISYILDCIEYWMKIHYDNNIISHNNKTINVITFYNYF